LNYSARVQPQRITAIAIVAAFAITLLFEWLRPLRPLRESKPRRVVRNLNTGGIALALATLFTTPLLSPLTSWVALHRIGLLNLLPLSPTLHLILGVLLLDYTLWIWHFLSHRLAWIWRFHVVHHVDRDLDSSTALRFHFGEHALSILYRAAQIVVIGASVQALWMWQLLLFVSILFHHSNIELPIALERWLVRLIVTPRMHGIHHSDQFSETDSNWSSLLSVWDYLHGTILLSVPQNDITIGVPAYQKAEDVTLGRILALPFRRQRRDFHRGDGTLQTRAHETAIRTLAR